ncbi:MAG: hypothetical protein ACYC4H_09455, partial [Desulfocucumaceae bacterium]
AWLKIFCCSSTGNKPAVQDLLILSWNKTRSFLSVSIHKVDKMSKTVWVESIKNFGGKPAWISKLLI